MSGCACCPRLQTSAPLQPVVEAIWISNPRADFECEVVPDGTVDLCFACSDTEVQTVLLGPATRFSTFRMKAGVFHICVRFRPGVGALLLGRKAYTLTDSYIPFQFPEDFNLERLLENKDLSSRRLLIECFVGRLLIRDYPRPPLYLSQAIRLIHEMNGDVRIHDIARRLSVSLRQLERSFLETVGMGPKLYARIARVRAAWSYVKTHPQSGCADVAAQYGFADQAHLIKEMHSVLGRSLWAN